MRLMKIPGIAQFRIIQENKKELIVQIVKGCNFSSEVINNVKQQLGEILGNMIRIKIDIVNEISPDPSGKVRSVISKVRANF